MGWAETAVVLLVITTMLLPGLVESTLLRLGRGAIVEDREGVLRVVRRVPEAFVKEQSSLRAAYTRAAAVIRGSLASRAPLSEVESRWPDSTDPSLSAARELLGTWLLMDDIPDEEDRQLRSVLAEIAEALASGRVLVDADLHRVWVARCFIRDNAIGLVAVLAAAGIVLPLAWVLFQ